jgi:hypothetical protein
MRSATLVLALAAGCSSSDGQMDLASNPDEARPLDLAASDRAAGDRASADLAGSDLAGDAAVAPDLATSSDLSMADGSVPPDQASAPDLATAPDLAVNADLSGMALTLGFAQAATFAVGTSPQYLAAGDLNGDNHPDLVVANAASNSVSVLLNSGNGGFGAANPVGVDKGPVGVVLADFNKDGKLDFATANTVGLALFMGSTSVALGDGQGGFGGATNFIVGSGTHWVTSGDYDKDGNLDLAFANVKGNNSSLALGKGDGTFQAAMVLGTAATPQTIATTDLNSDGKLDLVTGNASGTVGVQLGNGDGTFQAQTGYNAGANLFHVVPADLDRDGHPDVVMTVGIVSLGVMHGDGTGSLEAIQMRAGTGTTLAVADFDRDGNLDLALADPGGTLDILLGDGNLGFAPAVKYMAGAHPNGVIAADLNGDGLPDAVITNLNGASISVFLNTSK